MPPPSPPRVARPPKATPPPPPPSKPARPRPSNPLSRLHRLTTSERSAGHGGGGGRPEPRTPIQSDNGVAGAPPSPPTGARAATTWGATQNRKCVAAKEARPRRHVAPPPHPPSSATAAGQQRPGKGPEPTARVLTAPSQWHLPCAALPPPPPPPDHPPHSPRERAAWSRCPAVRGHATLAQPKGAKTETVAYSAVQGEEPPGTGGVAPPVNGSRPRRPGAASGS